MTEKQKKVVKGINHSSNSGKTTPLGTKPNDECYTSMQDILNEMSRWAALGKFQGKSIICPCDWDIVEGEEIYGITITYKDQGVEIVVNNVYKDVKEVTYDLWSEDEISTVTKINLNENEIEQFLRTKLTCNFINTFVQNARAWGIKSITASGYNPATGKGTPFQEVDYNKYDICCTNPPFSLYGDFMKAIVGKIDFIVLAPFLDRVNPCIGLPLMLKQAYLGWGFFGHLSTADMHLKFKNPTKANNYTGEKLVSCDWITSFNEAQIARDEQLKNYDSGIDYETYKDEFVEMVDMTLKDGTHPVRVPTKQFPSNYQGWMFASIGVLGELNFNQYEWYITGCKGYFNSHEEFNPFSHKATDLMVKNPSTGKGFHGIVFRKKPQAKEN